LNDLDQRIRKKELLKKVGTPEEASLLFKDGMMVATSGNPLMGYPKATFLALADRMKQEGEIKIDLLSAGPLGPEVEESLVRSNGIRTRIGAVGSGLLRDAINRGEVRFIEGKGGQLPAHVRQGRFGKIDLAVIEAIGITEEGNIIPSTAVYDTPEWAELASSLIVEINQLRPLEMEGIHDIYLKAPRQPIPIVHPLDRIGTPFIPVDPEKITLIVGSMVPDREASEISTDTLSRRIAKEFIQFLEKERQAGKWTPPLPPLEVGIGGIGSAILQELGESDLSPLFFYMPAITDPILDLIDRSKVGGVSGMALRLSLKAWTRFQSEIEKYKELIILRPVSISNSSEVVQRLGVISINVGLEVDLQGQVNSSHLMGSKIWTGIAGSYDFSRNGALSIFTIPSTAKGGKISSIVPLVSHVDHTEHEVDIIVTEQGVADLRGLDPWEKAERIIEKCSHPDYRELLRDYLRNSKRSGGHIPFSFEEAFSFYERFQREGSMKGA
jgi:succinyl-CoA:acetate CoA-transferase